MSTQSGAVDGALAARIEDELPGATLPETPRRFAIFRFDADDEPVLHLWGLQTEKRAVAFHPGGSSTHRADSAEHIAGLIDLAMDNALVWLDA
ncbi:hypothetical protein [Actinocatenispora rupis]|uniref:Uncharacterized protein n=1 Tax=Actinocatenispora rupis TaxID=519421 RepID=A0A8J3NCD2_9ACTN|nr:hypothetical protein [Actinocatenispora rupis]GID11632.1 hypothetical protein Aru02nite_25210 [Actinocatenispora rupis]